MPADIPSDRVVGLAASTIVVNVARVVASPNEVTAHIWRNGHSETRFTYAELQAVSLELTRQLNAAKIQPGLQPKV